MSVSAAARPCARAFRRAVRNCGKGKLYVDYLKLRAGMRARAALISPWPTSATAPRCS